MAVEARNPRWPGALAAALAALLVLAVALVFALRADALRSLLERRLGAALGQPVSIEAASLHWDGGPVVALRGLSAGPPDAPALARIAEAHAAPRLLPLLSGRVHLKHAKIRGARMRLVRGAEGGWNFEPPPPRPTPGRAPAAGRLWLQALVLDDVEVQLRDAQQDLDLRLRADSMHDDADARWGTRLLLEGRAGRTPVRVEALTGPLLSLHASDAAMPIRARGEFARTRISLEGELAGPLDAPRGQAEVAVSGPTLSALYPTLKLALPSTPPYELRGRLTLRDAVYRLDGIRGNIGQSDIAGHGALDLSGARPLLKAALTSARFALADLGAAIGIPAGGAGGTRLLPDAPFDVPRMRSLDADVSLRADRLAVRPEVPLQNLSIRLRLRDGQLQLAPLAFAMAGGELVADVTLDANQQPLAARAVVDFRRLELARLFPTLDAGKVSSGRVDAQLRLAGRGRSVAQLLGSSDGTLALAMAGGRISHTLLAAASLDGGKLLPLLLNGDEPVVVRCAAASMTVERGIARSQVMVLDAATARVDARGAIDLGNERFALELEATPKRPSILSLRGPLTIGGTFMNPRVGVGAETLLRGGAAAALAVLNPLAALLPLLETGPAEDAACGELLAQAARAGAGRR
jgi:uncharacterized protein involved in outer membrane biogenesis